MSKIALTPNASGSGTFTIASPNGDTDRTLTLPDEAGTVLTGASDIESQVKTATNATGSAPIYACRAWVNFNGTGTVAIRASGNVTSITDNGTGVYTVNFTTAMSDANYCAVASTGRDSSGGANLGASFNFGGTAPTTSAIKLNTRNRSSGANADTDHVFVAIFR